MAGESLTMAMVLFKGDREFMASTPDDFTSQLRTWMQQVGLSSFKALSTATGVSEKQIRNLRRGKIMQLSLETLLKLSDGLQLPLSELVQQFSPTGTVVTWENSSSASDRDHLQPLRQEYDRLQAKLETQQETLKQDFQRHSLQTLESLILQLPTAAYAAQQNPQAPAVRLLPLLRPLDQLLQEWGIEAIAPVGAEVEYDPQVHQLMEGHANPGDRVRIRYTGYRQGETLLYRAKVSPV